MGVRGRICALAVVLVAASTASAEAKTPIPHVTGPLPVSATSYPFGAADHQLVPQDLRKHGYVDEEYLVSGTANVYDWPATGPAVVRTPNAPYPPSRSTSSRSRPSISRATARSPSPTRCR